MDPSQYLLALRKRWIVIVVTTVLGALAGLGYAAAQPVLYQATSSVYVSSEGADTTLEQLQGGTFAQDIAQSYVTVATEPVVLQQVIDSLGLNETTTQLAKSVTATLTANTVVIKITATATSPQLAARIANGTTDALSTTAGSLASSKNAGIVLHTVAEASAPSAPSSPNVPFLVLTGLAVGLLLGLAYAIGRQLLDSRLRDEDEVRGTAGLENAPFLGTVSHSRGRDGVANVVRNDPHGIIAEEYRRLVTNLEFAGIDRRIRSVTVTSALAGDGKTTTSLNLAVAAAERQQRVLLVDGDLRRPSVAEYLGVDGGVGLTNVLLGTATPHEAIQRVGDIDVLPAGLIPPSVTQLITSSAMARFLEELLMRYDFVVVDAPPLLPVVDALSLARLTDGAILVARAGRTRRKQFAQASESLRTVEAVVRGVVLNDVPRSRGGNYGYEYGTSGTAGTTRQVLAGDAVHQAPERFFGDDGDAQAHREPVGAAPQR